MVVVDLRVLSTITVSRADPVFKFRYFTSNLEDILDFVVITCNPNYF